MEPNGPNHSFIVWSTCFLWVMSMFAIIWSLLLFYCVGDMLILTGTDLVNAIVLLSGIVILPTTLHMLCYIATNKKINLKSKVSCCPLWVCIVWIIIINFIGAVLCMQRINSCKNQIILQITDSMNEYRTNPKQKHFIDNLQWSLKCCGLKSYKDWFNRDWYDETRNYEWEPPSRKCNLKEKLSKHITDSVPLSCCKSGSCISNYLSELGTYSINIKGCAGITHNIVLVSMSVHLVIFMTIIFMQVLLLRFLSKKQCGNDGNHNNVQYNVRNIMSVKDNFRASSESYVVPPDDSDESMRQYHDENY